MTPCNQKPIRAICNANLIFGSIQVVQSKLLNSGFQHHPSFTKKKKHVIEGCAIRWIFGSFPWQHCVRNGTQLLHSLASKFVLFRRKFRLSFIKKPKWSHCNTLNTQATPQKYSLMGRFSMIHKTLLASVGDAPRLNCLYGGIERSNTEILIRN